MHRLRQFREHEVCDIDNAANRIESDRLQACLQPKGRSCTAHVLDHKRAVTTAETEILNVHLQWRWPFRQKRELHWIAQTQAEDGAYFTRHAEMSQRSGRCVRLLLSISITQSDPSPSSFSPGAPLSKSSRPE